MSSTGLVAILPRERVLSLGSGWVHTQWGIYVLRRSDTQHHDQAAVGERLGRVRSF